MTKRNYYLLKTLHPEIHWKEMAGMRDKMIHVKDSLEQVVKKTKEVK